MTKTEKSESTYEIVVWVKGHNNGHRFTNKPKSIAEEIITCVGSGKGFKLVTENEIHMAFGPGMVSHVQVRNMGEVNDR